jgi:hypothetical protein
VTLPMAAWLTWASLSIVVAVLTALAVAIALPYLEAAVVTFGLGMAYSAATPRLLRAIWHRLHRG